MPVTGEICQTSGIYKWSGHSDGTINCHVTHNEYTIPMQSGNRFPPTKHCEKGALWTYLRPM